jgi:hypothetical protein
MTTLFSTAFTKAQLHHGAPHAHRVKALVVRPAPGDIVDG